MGDLIMTQPDRKLRRVACLQAPHLSFNPQTLDTLIDEGFTDINLWIKEEGGQNYGHFLIDDARQMTQMAHDRGLDVVLFSLYIKGQEPLVHREPERAMIGHPWPP